MSATLSLWGHAVAALLFAGVGVSQVRAGTASVPRTAFLSALGLTSLWALAMAGIGGGAAITWVAESLRNLGWLGFMFAVLRRDPGARHDRAVKAIYGVVVLVALTGIGLATVQASTGPDLVRGAVAVRVLLRMMVAVGALVLVHHLYSLVAPSSRGGIRAAVIALATMWLVDLTLYTTVYIAGEWPAVLIALRGLCIATGTGRSICRVPLPGAR